MIRTSNPPSSRLHTCGGLALLLVLGGLAASPARADIYGFTDDGGTLHISNVPQDRRYRMVLRSPEAIALLPGRGAVRAIPTRFREEVRRVAERHSLDPALLHAVIGVESGFDAGARSPKGAMGLMQLMPETARRFCVDDPYDPEQNLRAGASYLSTLLRRYDNDLALALAAYNAGEGAVDRYGGTPPYAETRRYVPKVLAAYQRLRGEAVPTSTAALGPATAECER